jgi:hypothetical protein
MTDVVSKTNKEAMFLAGVGGKAGFNSPEVDRFIPNEVQESSAEVNSRASENMEGNTVIQGSWVC